MCNLCFDKFRMSCIPHFGTLYFYCLDSFGFSRMPYSWNYTAYTLLRLAAFSKQCEFKVPPLDVFHGFIALLYLFLKHCIVLHGLNMPQFIYTFTYWRTSLLLPSFDSYEYSYYKYPCAGFCGDIIFHLLWVNTKMLDCWITWWEYV